MRRLVTCAALGLAALIAAPFASAAPPAAKAQGEQRPMPTWDQVDEIVKKTLSDHYGYQPGDIISQSDVEKVIVKLAALGWKPADADKLIKATHADNDFIVSRLRNPAGWNFMRHIATYPDGYDRVDRLLHMPRGEMMVADLITNPGGYKLFQYMTTSQGGIEMGRMLENIPSGHDFNDPTGRIYTAEKLLGRLHKSYDVEKQRRRLDSG
jgi:hypothetical protein